MVSSGAVAVSAQCRRSAGPFATERSARHDGAMTKLLDQTVVLLGGSAGIGLETARLARSEGAEVVLVGRNAERLERAAQDLGARSTAAFDANDPAAIKRFFD